MDAAFLPADWQAPAGVRALAVTRAAPGFSLPPFDRCNLGLRSGDDPEIVQANRQGLVETLRLPSLPVWLNQVHGTTTSVVRAARMAPVPVAEEPAADAAVTRERGVVLAVLSADCLPVLIAADEGAGIAAVHAGWRGLAAGVIESAVAAMAVDPAGLQAWLGPAIGPHDYEVGEEVRSAFLAIDPVDRDAFVPTRPGHWLCDLYALARRRLARLGVDRVAGGGLNTFADRRRFHSHRRDGARSGRQACLIWMRTDAGVLDGS